MRAPHEQLLLIALAPEEAVVVLQRSGMQL